MAKLRARRIRGSVRHRRQSVARAARPRLLPGRRGAASRSGAGRLAAGGRVHRHATRPPSRSVTLANEHMANAIRVLTIERGVDPRELAAWSPSAAPGHSMAARSPCRGRTHPRCHRAAASGTHVGIRRAGGRHAGRPALEHHHHAAPTTEWRPSRRDFMQRLSCNGCSDVRRPGVSPVPLAAASRRSIAHALRGGSTTSAFFNAVHPREPVRSCTRLQIMLREIAHPERVDTASSTVTDVPDRRPSRALRELVNVSLIIGASVHGCSARSGARGVQKYRVLEARHDRLGQGMMRTPRRRRIECPIRSSRRP